MIHTEQTRKRMSEMRTGSRNPFFGKKHTPEMRAQLTANLRLYRDNRTYDINPSTIRIPVGNDLAYLAGIIDGEGSIRFSDGRPFVAIYNSDDELKRWIFRSTGINPKWCDYRGRVPGWQWCTTAAANVYLLCSSLLPFLVIKKPDAIAAIAHLEAKYGAHLTEKLHG